MRISPNKWLSSISWVYIEFLQGTPLLLQLFLAFFGISIVLGVNLSPLQAATFALTAFTSALVCVTHEVGFAREGADRVIFLADGMLVEDTTPTEFFNYPKEERTKKFLAQILH